MEKPILLDFPYGFESERLTIRGPLPGDGEELHTAVSESLAELRPWMPWATDLMTAKQYEARVREGQLKFLSREDLWMMLLLKGTNIIIGGSGLHRIDWNVPKFEIGYWVRSRYGRKGYISEAVEAITKFAFDELGARRVEIRCDALNERSAAIPRRLGFELEGTIHNDDRHHVHNRLRDTLIFALVKPDQ
ncbi:MAG: GNAT family N-acetyltransferase [Candidatus Promineifilaceae bacterium]|nr:GNAT family N-acetyltransferase [Candidatus Promineifilaceae bacterium]